MFQVAKSNGMCQKFGFWPQTLDSGEIKDLQTSIILFNHNIYMRKVVVWYPLYSWENWDYERRSRSVTETRTKILIFELQDIETI